ncbi:MAG: diacylglycerol kinase family lipid kinase [Clostridia bacterium]|nr:diacylglycerol kinase family lipid kinase [Clostridia bacterium]
MKHLFIINPVAGKGHAGSYIPEIHNHFRGRTEEYHIEITQNPGHARDIAAWYAEKGDYRIYSAGGDGTLNEVLNGMAGTGCSLGVLPAGSGNDFIKSIYKSRDYKDILEKTINGVAEPIDCGLINDRYFINIMSVGFDAEVAYYSAKANQKLHWKGTLSYFAGIAVSLLKGKLKFPVKLTFDDKETIEMEICLTACTNGRYYGGGFIPVPTTEYNDGILDVCFVEKKSFLGIISLIPKYMKGKHTEIKGVNFRSIHKMRVEGTEPLKINIEGEVVISKTIDVEIKKGLINFIIPSE